MVGGAWFLGGYKPDTTTLRENIMAKAVRYLLAGLVLVLLIPLGLLTPSAGYPLWVRIASVATFAACYYFYCRRDAEKRANDERMA